MYVSLASGYTIRNDRDCSYVVKIERIPDTADINLGGLAIPSFLGYVISNLGHLPYEENLQKISELTGISAKFISKFLNQLIENPEPRKIKINEQVSIIFPPNFLRKYDIPTPSKHYDVADFNWKNDYIYARPSVPFSVNLMVTTKCTTDCKYCYANRGLKSLLTTDEMIDLVNHLKEIGVVNLSLTGGDIFAHEGWERLLRAIVELGYNPFLSTKTPLAREEVRILKDLGCTEFQFSIDSSIPKVLHELINADMDYIARVRKMFNACIEYGLQVNARTVLTSLNSDLPSIIQLHEFLREFECVQEWSLTPAFFSEYKTQNYKYLKPDNQEFEILYDYLKAADSKLKITVNRLDENGYSLKRCDTVENFVRQNTICLANCTVISVLANGKCSICEMLYEHEEFILGDIRTQPIEELWNSPKALYLYSPPQEDVSLLSPCRKCKVYDSCKQSMGKRVCYMDIMKSGVSHDGPDPRCPEAPDTDKIL